jgi:protein gp37
MVFVNSMSDLFHEDVPDEYVSACAEVMTESPWHIYQVLTKRSKRLREMLSNNLSFAAARENIWWGVSVENRKYGFPRIDDLQQSPAAVRFLSIEPLLEDLGEINLDGIHWVIVGGESGPGARLIDGQWVLSILEQCQRARVPFFFKQWGGVRKSRAGRTLNGRTYDDFPPVIRAQLPPRAHRDQVFDRLSSRFATTLHTAAIAVGRSAKDRLGEADLYRP